MTQIRPYSLRCQCLDHVFYGTFMGHMRQGRGQCPGKRPFALAGSNAMNIDSTEYRRVDEAQRNPPNIAGMTHRSSGWWIPARKAPASTLQEALGTRGGLK